MASKCIAVLFMYFIACSPTAGTRVEETAAARKNMEETAAAGEKTTWLIMKLLTAFTFKTTTTKKQDKVIHKNTRESCGKKMWE